MTKSGIVCTIEIYAARKIIFMIKESVQYNHKFLKALASQNILFKVNLLKRGVNFKDLSF